MEKRIEQLEKEIQGFKHETNERLENIEDCLRELIKEVRITNNTLQGVFNLGHEFLRLGVKQIKVSEIMTEAYGKSLQELRG